MKKPKMKKRGRKWYIYNGGKYPYIAHNKQAAIYYYKLFKKEN